MFTILFGIAFLTLFGFLIIFFLNLILKLFKQNESNLLNQKINELSEISCHNCELKEIHYPHLLNEKIINKSINDTNLQPKKNIKTSKNVAKIFCLGDDSVKKDYIFNGENNCNTIFSFYHGDKKCKFSCLGKGDCIKTCPVNAIKRDKLNRVWIDALECIGCENCLKICPTHVIKMIPENGGYFVACSNQKDGQFVKEICKNGCFNCKKCEIMVNDSNRIIIENNHAVIKYSSKLNIYDAASVCPVDVIVPIKNQKSFMNDVKAYKNEI